MPRYTVRTFAVAAALMAAAFPMTAGHAVAPRATAAAQLPDKWVEHADVDGDGGRDRVDLVRHHDLAVKQGWGSGHFTVRVHLATGDTVARRMHVSYYDGGRGSDWTPWFGAAQIDHVTGDDLVVGSTSGAHTEVFNVVALHQGHLVKVISPGSGPETGWTLNSSYGTGDWGYRCTRRGVQSRLVYPNGDHSRFHIDRTTYVLRDGWDRIRHFHDTVNADADGSPPTATDDYATFACKGLPSRW